MNKHEFKIGQLARSSWSYNMTFQYFWKVIKVTPCTVTLQMLERKQVGGCNFMPELVAVDKPMENVKPIVARWNKSTDSIYVKHDGLPYGVLRPYNGEKVSENHLD